MDTNMYPNQYTYEMTGFPWAIIIATFIFMAVYYLVIAAGVSKMFEKAGRPRWAAFVPFIQQWVWVDIVAVRSGGCA